MMIQASSLDVWAATSDATNVRSTRRGGGAGGAVRLPDAAKAFRISTPTSSSASRVMHNSPGDWRAASPRACRVDASSSAIVARQRVCAAGAAGGWGGGRRVTERGVVARDQWAAEWGAARWPAPIQLSDSVQQAVFCSLPSHRSRSRDGQQERATKDGQTRTPQPSPPARPYRSRVRRAAAALRWAARLFLRQSAARWSLSDAHAAAAAAALGSAA